MAGGFSEHATVQAPILKYAEKIGWLVISQEEALARRAGEGGLFFREVLEERLIALNPGVITARNVAEVIERLANARPSIEGNEEVLLWIRGQRSVYLEAEGREVNVRIVDFDDLESNVFEVTEEWQFTNGKFTNRIDVVFLVNGIPVAMVEAKAAHKADAVDAGLIQVRRYHRETPEMLVAPQVFDITHLVAFYYGVTWSLDRRHLFNWKEEEPGNFEQKVKRFFDRERFLRVLREYIVFSRRDDELSKVILRQHQTRAVERVVDRVRDDGKHRGLVWHAQGAGKTLTMITAARHVLTDPKFGKPTVLMLVDRNELESQLFGNLAAFGLESAETATSKRHLRQLLEDGYRGLIVTMIHKFDRIPKDVNTSEDIVVLVDEAHRTTGGDLGNYLMAALPNATYVGFTGTPVDKTAHGKGTFKVFGGEDPEGYLDKYSIAESIEDGTTLPLRYSLAPNEMRVPREQLEEEFLEVMEAEGVSDIADLNRILDKAVTLKAFLKSENRVARVAEFVADHYRSNVEPLGYKAFLVGVDREACALYKKAIDEHLPPEYTEVVYTAAHNDSPELKAHHLSAEREKALRRAFLKPASLPKIFIVTEKLLTGFDAPILYAMYLDKPMRDHTLLQAIARVNRPYEFDGEIRKPTGFVLDFVGVFDNLEKALAFDSDVISGVVENLDVLRGRFESLMEAQAPGYLALADGPVDDKTVERVIDAFVDKEARDVFVKFFKELETLYEILSPDPFLRDYLEDYRRLAVLQKLIRTAFDISGAPVRDLMNKTEELVRKHVTVEGLDEAMPLYEINEETLGVLRESDGSDDSKIVNLAKSLAVSVGGEEDKPHLIPLGERVERVLALFEERQLSTKDALKQLEEALAEYLQAQKEQEERGFDARTFSVYWLLHRAEVAEATELAPEIESVFERLPYYRENPAQRRDLKAEIHRLLLGKLEARRRAQLVDELLRLRRQ